jgi:hypothetical protein
MSKNFNFTVEFDGKLLQVCPTGRESLMQALEREVSAHVGEPVRLLKAEPRGPSGERSVSITFESGARATAYIVPKAA